jgi:hypothetical protein
MTGIWKNTENGRESADSQPFPDEQDYLPAALATSRACAASEGFI